MKVLKYLLILSVLFCCAGCINKHNTDKDRREQITETNNENEQEDTIDTNEDSPYPYYNKAIENEWFTSYFLDVQLTQIDNEDYLLLTIEYTNNSNELLYTVDNQEILPGNKIIIQDKVLAYNEWDPTLVHYGFTLFDQNHQQIMFHSAYPIYYSDYGIDR